MFAILWTALAYSDSVSCCASTCFPMAELQMMSRAQLVMLGATFVVYKVNRRLRHEAKYLKLENMPSSEISTLPVSA